MSKKNKFDLTHLVHAGYLKPQETLFFVSDPSATFTITKQPNNEYKLTRKKEVLTVHKAAEICLGQEPPDHASRWLRTASGKTLYELWRADVEGDEDAYLPRAA